MAHKFIKDLKEGDSIGAVYLVREKSFDATKNGDPYISLELSDRTGVVDARKWDARKDLFDSFSVDDFVKVKGRVSFYKKYPQINLEVVEKTSESGLDISLYVPASDRDREEMFSQFLLALKDIRNPYLGTLLDRLFGDNEFASGFKTAPSATDFHHPYIGGLLEHTLSCVELAKIVVSRYGGIDPDLLLAGAALHDIGKMDEIAYKRSLYYTDKGRLIGHIVLGVNIVDKEIADIPGFPDQLKNLILHIILSHHGEYEWGSPKRPMCLEAVILHHIDNLDAKINGFKQFVKTYNDPYSSWTKHSKMFREFLYKKQISNEEVGHEEEG